MKRDPEVLREALSEVLDPCSIATGRPQDLVSMGVVDQIEWDGCHVTVSLVLTDPACFFFRDIKTYIHDVLSPIENVEEIDVVIDSTKIWVPPHGRRVQRHFNREQAEIRLESGRAQLGRLLGPAPESRFARSDS